MLLPPRAFACSALPFCCQCSGGRGCSCIFSVIGTSVARLVIRTALKRKKGKKPLLGDYANEHEGTSLVSCSDFSQCDSLQRLGWHLFGAAHSMRVERMYYVYDHIYVSAMYMRVEHIHRYIWCSCGPSQVCRLSLNWLLPDTKLLSNDSALCGWLPETFQV